MECNCGESCDLEKQREEMAATATNNGGTVGGRNIPRMWDIFGKSGNNNNNNNNNNIDIGPEEIVVDNFSTKLKLDDSSSLSTNNDSAISIGSVSDDDVYLNKNDNAVAASNNNNNSSSSNSSKKKKHSRTSRKDTAADVTADSAEVKYLERHLSMKKTIRKKIMRDLQKAFVEDPNEFRVEDISREQLKADINLQSLSFAPSGKKKGKKNNESNFLDFLRTGSDNKSSLSPSAAIGAQATPTGVIGAANHNHHNHHHHHHHGRRNSSNKYNEDDGGDSGHSSPVRGTAAATNNAAAVADIIAVGSAATLTSSCDDSYNPSSCVASEQPDEERSNKTSFWRRFTIKGSRNKRS